MKKNSFIFSVISLVLILATLTTGCNNKEVVAVEKFEKTNIEVPYEPIKYTPKVRPYKVKADLSNIENLKQFGEFSGEQKELLIKNNFVVNPTKEEQLFYIYEDNGYKNIPSFITTDSVLQVYHIFYDYTLRTLEDQKLLGLLEELTDKMLNNSILIYNDIENEEIKNIQLKNIAFSLLLNFVWKRIFQQMCLKKQKYGFR